jgi:hypothetical protein
MYDKTMLNSHVVLHLSVAFAVSTLSTLFKQSKHEPGSCRLARCYLKTGPAPWAMNITPLS